MARTPQLVERRFVMWGVVLGVAVLSIAGLSYEAWAQTRGADVGTIYFSGSPTSYVDNIVAESFTPFQFYIVAEIDYADIGAGEQNATNGMTGWEAGTVIPADIMVTQAIPNPPNALIHCTCWLVGLGTMFTAETSPMRLVTLTGLITSAEVPQNLFLEIRGLDSGSFYPPVPGFLDGKPSGECFLPDLTPAKCNRGFAAAKGMYVNRTVPVEAPSWGDLKSRFGG